MGIERVIAVARGDEPADLVLENGKVVDVVSGQIRPTGIAIADGLVAGLGEGYRGRTVVDLRGRYVCPGFIDAHVHVESSLARPREFARAVLPHGVTTAVSNPHEIANVLGIEGIRYMGADARSTPLELLFTIPSCVPATSLSTAGARLTLDDIELLLREPGMAGLGEVMDFAGVVAGDARVLGEIGRCRGLAIDGHCPGLSGRDLNAYAAAGMTSEHECTTVEEAREKLEKGMKIFIREGSVARNLNDLLSLITPFNERWISFCTDDCRLSDLVEKGSIDHLVRMAIARGVAPVTAIRMATLNPAEHFRLYDRGVIAPGRRADFTVFSDLDAPRPELAYCRGVLAASDGRAVPGEPAAVDESMEKMVRDTVNVDWSGIDLRIPSSGSRIRVIGVIPDQLLTENILMEPRVENGCAVADPARDLLKIAVIERHRASGRVGKGFVRGIGLIRGAMAGTVAHDHHNLIVIGADDRSMMTAARAVADAGGGQAVADGETVLAMLPLPIAGLMSDQPMEIVLDQAASLTSVLKRLGSPLYDPFMVMSFLGLEVIPSLKLTDLGLVDVNLQKVVSLFAAQ
ncbi:MAG TPA: adenine deaminase [Geobacteraceae bacterium]|nr:adenine deaminase [Geobacteraceae bacterium]